MDIKSVILSDPINNWFFSRYRDRVYLVGGYLRDLLRSRISKDRDFVFKGDVERLSLEVSVKFGGTLVVLKKKKVCRIVFPDKSVIDISLLETSIEEDLQARDYTINSLAWSPEKGLLDLYGGIADLGNRKIRVISRQNIADDPLRILRAYRFAATLHFTIDRDTRSCLKHYASDIKGVSSERVTYEIILLLNSYLTHKYMMLAFNDNVLHELFDISNRSLLINLKLLKKFDIFWNRIHLLRDKRRLNSNVSDILNKDVGQELKSVGLVRFAILFLGAEHAAGMKRFRLSNRVQNAVHRMSVAYSLASGRITRNRLYEILRTAKGCEYEAALLISVIKEKAVDKYLLRTSEYLKISEKSILSGHEIKGMLKSVSGQQIGDIQEELRRRQFAGTIKGKTEAKEFIRANLT